MSRMDLTSVIRLSYVAKIIVTTIFLLGKISLRIVSLFSMKSMDVTSDLYINRLM